jgi:hypothetical protein
MGGWDVTHIERRIQALVIPPAVLEVMDNIRKAGGEVYVVGGAIRRWVWQSRGASAADYQDWDLTTNLPQEALVRLAAGQKHPGERFGTFRLGEGVEVTLMRREGDYQDARHPSRLIPTPDIAADLNRRDFTVNAVAFDGRRIVAVEHGIQDLAGRRLRAVGRAEERFREDPLRILRLIRMMALEDASADAETLQAARDLAQETLKVSRERRLAEFLRFLESDLAAWSLWDQAGMSQSMEWPSMCARLEAGRWVNPPRSALGRLAAYHLARYGTIQHLRTWAGWWPLPRDWPPALAELGRAGGSWDPAAWAQRARREDGRFAWLFRDLAEAAGLPAAELERVRLSLSTDQIMQEFDLQGVVLGRVLSGLRGAIAAEPLLNEPDILRGKIRDYLRDSGNDC